jgi:hypothetical protein
MALDDTIREALHAALDEWFNDVEGNLNTIGENAGKAAAGGILGDVGRLTSIFSDLLGAIPVIGSLLEDATNPIAAVENAAGKFGTGFGLGWLAGSIGLRLMEPLLLPAFHASAAAVTNEIFDPDTAARLVAQGIISSQFGASEASGSGFDGQHFNWLADSALTRPETGELLRLYNLQLIGQSDVELAFQRHGIPQFWWGPLLALSRNFLSVADLALAQLRGDLSDTDAGAYAGLLGMTPDDFSVLLANTGEPPGVMQLLEAYRRGFIDEPTLELGIRQSRVRDQWIPVLEQLRFERMSAATAIDATRQNYLTFDQGQAAAALAGLDPQDFQTAFDVSGEPMAIGEMLALWKRGDVTQDQVEQAIRESHIKDEYIPMYLDYGTHLFSVYYVKEILGSGQGDTQWGINYLMALGYSQDDATRFVNTFAGNSTGAAKKITEAQILELYDTHGVTSDEATQLLAQLGYAPDQITLILAAEDSKVLASEQTKAISAVRTKYLAGHYSQQNASGLLDQFGLPSAQRDALIADWNLELQGQVKVLTEGQIADAVYYQIYTIDQGIAALQAQGYSQADAQTLIYIRLHGIPQAQTATPAVPPQGTGLGAAGT